MIRSFELMPSDVAKALAELEMARNRFNMADPDEIDAERCNSIKR